MFASESPEIPNRAFRSSLKNRERTKPWILDFGKWNGAGKLSECSSVAPLAEGFRSMYWFTVGRTMSGIKLGFQRVKGANNEMCE